MAIVVGVLLLLRLEALAHTASARQDLGYLGEGQPFVWSSKTVHLWREG